MVITRSKGGRRGQLEPWRRYLRALSRTVGHGLPGALMASCLRLLRGGRAGGGGLAPARAPCLPHTCAAAPRQVGPTWALQMPSNGHRAMAPAGEGGRQPAARAGLFGAFPPLNPQFRLQPVSSGTRVREPVPHHATSQDRNPESRLAGVTPPRFPRPSGWSSCR